MTHAGKVFSADDGKLHARKNRRLALGSSVGSGEVTQRKPGVANTGLCGGAL